MGLWAAFMEDGIPFSEFQSKVERAGFSCSHRNINRWTIAYESQGQVKAIEDSRAGQNVLEYDDWCVVMGLILKTDQHPNGIHLRHIEEFIKKTFNITVSAATIARHCDNFEVTVHKMATRDHKQDLTIVEKSQLHFDWISKEKREIQGEFDADHTFFFDSTYGSAGNPHLTTFSGVGR